MIFNKGLIKSTMVYPVLVCASVFYSISSQAAAGTGSKDLVLMVTAKVPPNPKSVTSFSADFIGSNTILLTDPYHTGRLTGNDFQIEVIGGKSTTPTALEDTSVNVSYTIAGLPKPMTASLLINGQKIDLEGSSNPVTNFKLSAQTSNYFTGSIILGDYSTLQTGTTTDVHAQVTLHLEAQS